MRLIGAFEVPDLGRQSHGMREQTLAMIEAPVNPETHEPLPVHTTGMLLVHGPTVFTATGNHDGPHSRVVRLSYFTSATPVQLVWTVNESCQRDRAPVFPTPSLPQPAASGGRLGKRGGIGAIAISLTRLVHQPREAVGVEVRQSN